MFLDDKEWSVRNCEETRKGQSRGARGHTDIQEKLTTQLSVVQIWVYCRNEIMGNDNSCLAPFGGNRDQG